MFPYGAPEIDVSQGYRLLIALIIGEVPLCGLFAVAYSALKNDKATIQIIDTRIMA